MRSCSPRSPGAADPDLAEREDVFSALLLAGTRTASRLTDGEVRDELVTLLVAGHETTATGLAWTFDCCCTIRPRCSQRRAPSATSGYLDAVVKEALRMRPVIPGVGRVVQGGEPFALGELRDTRRASRSTRRSA